MRESVRQAGRATVYLGLAVGLALGSYLFITVLLITVIGTLVVVGVGLLPETVLLMHRMAGAKRRHVAGWTGREIPEAYRPITGGLRQSVRTAVRDPGTYGDLRWMIAYYGYGCLGCLALPLWPAGIIVDGVWCGLLGREAVILPLISRLADLDAAWSTTLLKPSPKALLAARVQELTRTRADAIAAHSAELRRIERDLHDGAQARLVSLSMRIGLARRAYASDPEAAGKLLDDAQDQAEAALTELRHVVRGIHPPILSDRGLAGAVRALAAGSGLGVTVQVDGLEDGPRAPAAVEAAAYFVVAEALTNAAKHSGAGRAEVRLTRTGTGLRVLVRDEGRGGAENTPMDAAGSGLPGMRRRVELLGGGASGVGYLLKDRVGRVEEFLDALDRVASGGTALDPEVVTELFARRRGSPLDSLTPRELEVLKLMAEGHDNTAIATTLVITERAVSKHIGNVFAKLGLPSSDSGHRRVLAVLAYLQNT